MQFDAGAGDSLGQRTNRAGGQGCRGVGGGCRGDRHGSPALAREQALDGRLRQDARSGGSSASTYPTAGRCTSSTRVANAASAPSWCAISSAGSTEIREAARQTPLTIYIVAATRDKLIPDLRDGLADIAIGNLTVTDERQKVIDFVAPDAKIVNIEILATGPASPSIGTIDDLSGKTVHVRKVSSYYDSLTALNERFRKAGKAACEPCVGTRRARGRGHARNDQCRTAAGNGRRRLEGKNMVAGAAQTQGARGHRAARADPEGLGHPQEQPAARGRSRRFLQRLGEEGGRGSLSPTAVHEDDQGAEQCRGQCRPEAFRADHRAVRQVWKAVQLRSADARRAGLPGIHARPEQEKPCRRDRRHADHAGDGASAEGR